MVLRLHTVPAAAPVAALASFAFLAAATAPALARAQAPATQAPATQPPSAPPPSAQPPATQGPAGDAERRADSLFFEARQLMAGGNYRDACPKLAEAASVHPGIGTLLNLGDCYTHVGKVGSAWNAFEQAAEAAHKANDDREREARRRMSEVEPHVCRLTVAVPATSAVDNLVVRIDGAPIDRAGWGAAVVVDPGTHKIDAQATNRKPWSTSLEILSPTATVTVPALEALAPAPAPPGAAAAPEPSSAPSSSTGAGAEAPPSGSGGIDQRTIALGAGGVGVAGVIVGSIFGILSMTDKGSANSHCALGPGGNECDQTGVNDRSSAISAGNVSTVAFVVGGVGLAAGAVLWFTAPPRDGSSAPSVGVSPGLGGATVAGRF